MSRREEFLSKALELRDEYENATNVIHQMMHENRAVGSEWDAAVVRQISALDAWMELPSEYPNLSLED
ncbi:MAG: hypothetical protein ACRESJ_20890 [Pseudomonas sp.]|uniref:hypothetical protein n=1 Tax=Pseudomonas sp. TaxID=306 RepID=UPI003D6FFAF6